MLWASLLAFLVSLGSMATSTILNNLDLHTTSHVISVLELMAAMGLVAWMKVKVSHPQFGSVSQTSLFLQNSLMSGMSRRPVRWLPSFCKRRRSTSRSFKGVLTS